MARSLLALALVAAQIQSWSGASLYLCLRGDGGVCCIDAGPDSCDCCRHEDEHDECAGHDKHPTPSSHDAERLAVMPCECTHVMLVQSQSPAIRRASPQADEPQSPAKLRSGRRGAG